MSVTVDVAVVGTGLIGASVGARGPARRGVERHRLGSGCRAPRGGRRAWRRRRPRRASTRRVSGADLVLVAAPGRGAPASRARGPGPGTRSGARSPTSARRRVRSARPRATTRASSAVIRSAAPRRAARSGRRAELFEGATWFLTPTAATAPERLRRGARARRRRSARAPSRSSPTRTTGSSRSRATFRTCSRTSSSTRPARRGSTVTTRCRPPAGRCAT